MIGLGGVAVETIVIYPNVFHDPPDSLSTTSQFFVVTGPADLFPPLGAATLLAGLAALAAAWPARQARSWLSGSLAALVLGQYLFSVLFFWPRNQIMFDEGAAEHSAEFLRQTAFEFELGHWGRLAAAAATATLAFIGLWLLHRRHVLAAAHTTADADSATRKEASR